MASANQNGELHMSQVLQPITAVNARSLETSAKHSIHICSANYRVVFLYFYASTKYGHTCNFYLSCQISSNWHSFQVFHCLKDIDNKIFHFVSILIYKLTPSPMLGLCWIYLVILHIGISRSLCIWNCHWLIAAITDITYSLSGLVFLRTGLVN